MRRILAVMCIVLGLFGVASAGPGVPSANVGESTPFFTGNAYTCQAGGPTEIPGIGVALDTSGGPVLVWITLGVHLSVLNAFIEAAPLVDGVRQLTGVFQWAGTSDDVIGSQGLYVLPAGTHSFSVELFCSAQAIILLARVTAYELPLVVPPKK
jgi:hypothetical protein